MSAVALLAAPASASASASASAGERATTGGLATRDDPVDVAAGALDITSVTFGQQRDRFVLKVTTAGAWSAGDLLPAAGRALCVKLFYGRVRSARSRVCVVAAGERARLRYTRLDPYGKAVFVRGVRGAVARPDTRSLQATFDPAAIELQGRRYSWSAESSWGRGPGCSARASCVDRVPDSGRVSGGMVRAPASSALRGCVAHGPTQRRAGPSNSPAVALTFDDGPSPYTASILRILERERVPATFFVIGSQARGKRGLLRRMLRGGSMIANHTLTHPNVAGAGGFAAQQIAATQSIIRRESGFKPCLFRPPYGAASTALTGVARSLGLLSILWDADSNDWQRPGTARIVANVLRRARPGSIILMHDGGGPRSQTVAALPAIIRGLRRRGLRFATVGQLLGLRAIGAAGSRAAAGEPAATASRVPIAAEPAGRRAASRRR